MTGTHRRGSVRSRLGDLECHQLALFASTRAEGRKFTHGRLAMRPVLRGHRRSPVRRSPDPTGRPTANYGVFSLNVGPTATDGPLLEKQGYDVINITDVDTQKDVPRWVLRIAAWKRP